jgi:hypothetical protein
MAKKVKQPKVELELIKARHEMNNAWRRLEQAITNYNLYFENKPIPNKSRIIHKKKCSICNCKFQSNRSDAKCCSDTCRSLNTRSNKLTNKKNG